MAICLILFPSATEGHAQIEACLSAWDSEKDNQIPTLSVFYRTSEADGIIKSTSLKGDYLQIGSDL